MSDLNNHIKNDKAKWIVTCVAIVLLFILLAGLTTIVITGTNPKDWFNKKKSDIVKEDVSNLLDVEVENSPRVLLAQGKTYAVTASNDMKYLETTLSATVLPEDAMNKKVSWRMSWSDKFQNLSTLESYNISDYWEISPIEDSTSVTVKLLNSIYGQRIAIDLYVLTDDGNFGAKATIFFSGSIVSAVFRSGHVGPYVFNIQDSICTTNLRVSTQDQLDVTNPINVYSVILSGFKDYFDVNCSSDIKDLILSFKASSFDICENDLYSSFGAGCTIQFVLTNSFKDKWRQSANDDSYLDVVVLNQRYNCEVIKIRFYLKIPVESVSLSDTQIEL